MKPLDLNALASTERGVTAQNGETYVVRPITPRVAGIIDAAPMMADGGEKVMAYYDAVALLVPTMPRELVDDLEPAQALAIIKLAGTEVRQVDEAAADPNGPGSVPSEAAPSQPEALAMSSAASS